jgi:uncharacterized membrane protein YgaE (UPF0421/DUF939 family)
MKTLSLLLQVSPFSSLSPVQNTAWQYGVVGIIAFLLSFFAWNQFKRLTEKNDKLEAKVDSLQREMVDLIVEERERLAGLVSENTKALNELRSTIVQFLLNRD